MKHIEKKKEKRITADTAKNLVNTDREEMLEGAFIA
jgi:hypothetical protein